MLRIVGARQFVFLTKLLEWERRIKCIHTSLVSKWPQLESSAAPHWLNVGIGIDFQFDQFEASADRPGIPKRGRTLEATRKF